MGKTVKIDDLAEEVMKGLTEYSKLATVDMKKAVKMTVCCALVLCCCYTHRRVIKAAVKGEAMPKAPGWHVWVPEENRK